MVDKTLMHNVVSLTYTSAVSMSCYEKWSLILYPSVVRKIENSVSNMA